MDPSLMNTSPIKISLQHEQAVLDIHQALINCINQFFIGWPVEHNGWTFHYPNNHGPRCKSINSGLYAVHYTRAFDGQDLYFDVKDANESNLSEARAEILYWLFTMAGNLGYYPEDLLESLGVYI